MVPVSEFNCVTLWYMLKVDVDEVPSLNPVVKRYGTLA